MGFSQQSSTSGMFCCFYFLRNQCCSLIFRRLPLTILNGRQERYQLARIRRWPNRKKIRTNYLNILLFIHHLGPYHRRQVMRSAGEHQTRIACQKSSANTPADKNHCIKNLNGLLKVLINSSILHSRSMLIFAE